MPRKQGRADDVVDSYAAGDAFDANKRARLMDLLLSTHARFSGCTDVCRCLNRAGPLQYHRSRRKREYLGVTVLNPLATWRGSVPTQTRLSLHAMEIVDQVMEGIQGYDRQYLCSENGLSCTEAEHSELQ